MKTVSKRFLLSVFLVLASACAPTSHIRQLREGQVTAQLSLTQERELPTLEADIAVQRDTLVIQDPEGREVIIMKAVKDENGEMVAHETLDAARVTAIDPDTSTVALTVRDAALSETPRSGGAEGLPQTGVAPIASMLIAVGLTIAGISLIRSRT